MLKFTKGKAGGRGREGQRHRENGRKISYAFHLEKRIRRNTPVCLVEWGVVSGRLEVGRPEGSADLSRASKGLS